MVKKMSKKKVDITFIDPKTMLPRCTFNQCVNKFTVEGYEVFTNDSGREFVSAYHECNECGQRVKAKGDGSRGYHEWKARQSSKSSDTHDDDMREEFGE